VLVLSERCWCPGALTLPPDRAIWGHVTVRLPGAGVPVGVVLAAA